MLAAVATPTPDPFTMSIAMAPLIVLFELSILLARWIERIMPPEGRRGRTTTTRTTTTTATTTTTSRGGPDDEEVDDDDDSDATDDSAMTRTGGLAADGPKLGGQAGGPRPEGLIADAVRPARTRPAPHRASDLLSPGHAHGRRSRAVRHRQHAAAAASFDAFSDDQRRRRRDEAVDKRIKAQLAKTRANPKDANAWAQLAILRFQRAGIDGIAQDGTYTEEGKRRLRLAADAWERHLALNPKQPNVRAANLMVAGLRRQGLNQLHKAVRAKQIVTAAEDPPSSNLYQQLAVLAYQARRQPDRRPRRRRARSISRRRATARRCAPRSSRSRNRSPRSPCPSATAAPAGSDDGTERWRRPLGSSADTPL